MTLVIEDTLPACGPAPCDPAATDGWVLLFILCFVLFCSNFLEDSKKLTPRRDVPSYPKVSLSSATPSVCVSQVSLGMFQGPAALVPGVRTKSRC